MTPTDLQALRRLLFFSAPEAARWLAADDQRPQGVEERTWNRWEAGARPVPDNIAARVQLLADWRRGLVSFGHEFGAPLVLVICDDPDDWPAHGSLRRPWQSAAAQLLADFGPDLVQLLPFDASAYRAWLQADSLRGRAARPLDAWAAHMTRREVLALPLDTDPTAPTQKAPHASPAPAGRTTARHP